MNPPNKFSWDEAPPYSLYRGGVSGSIFMKKPNYKTYYGEVMSGGWLEMENPCALKELPNIWEKDNHYYLGNIRNRKKKVGQ